MNKTDVSHGQDVVVGEEALPPDTAVHHVGEVTDWGGNHVNCNQGICYRQHDHDCLLGSPHSQAILCSLL